MFFASPGLADSPLLIRNPDGEVQGYRPQVRLNQAVNNQNGWQKRDVLVIGDRSADIVQREAASLPTGRDAVQFGKLESNRKSCQRSGQIPDEYHSELRIMQGDIISQRVSEWAMDGYGYRVSWEIDDFQSNGELILDKGFDDTLVEIREALKINGVDLDIITYENCVVRVVGTGQ